MWTSDQSPGRHYSKMGWKRTKFDCRSTHASLSSGRVCFSSPQHPGVCTADQLRERKAEAREASLTTAPGRTEENKIKEAKRNNKIQTKGRTSITKRRERWKRSRHREGPVVCSGRLPALSLVFKSQA